MLPQLPIKPLLLPTRRASASIPAMDLLLTTPIQFPTSPLVLPPLGAPALGLLPAPTTPSLAHSFASLPAASPSTPSLPLPPAFPSLLQAVKVPGLEPSPRASWACSLCCRRHQPSHSDHFPHSLQPPVNPLFRGFRQHYRIHYRSHPRNSLLLDYRCCRCHYDSRPISPDLLWLQLFAQR